MVFMNDDWKLMDKNDLVNDIYEHKRAYIIQNLDSFINELDEFKKKSLMRWLNRDDDDDESIINTKEDIKKLLFENRKMPMNQKKLLENQNKKALEIVKKPVKIVPIKVKEIESESENDSESDSDTDSSYISNYSYESEQPIK
jgi:hypothetical protein